MRVKRAPVLLALQGGLPIARQVANALGEAIAQNRLAAGDPVPSSRDLAAQFGVARNTVLSALAMLADDNLIETRPGIGTFVRAEGLAVPDGRERPALPFRLTAWSQRLPEAASVIEQAGAPQFDFRPGLPDLRTIPFDEWRRSAARKLRTLRSQVGSYGDPGGDADLRAEVARYVARSRGVRCRPGDVIITSGAQQAFDLIARVLIEPGASVAFEEPGYAPAAQTFTAAGARLCPVPVDGEGLDVEQIPAGVSLAYVTPSHQYPLGVSMSQARRAALLAWAVQQDAVIVEDDYDSEFQYSPGALPALQAANAAARVIYVGTFSKNLMPGIRLGYLVAPEALNRTFVTAKWLVDRHSDNVSQSVLAEFMASGQFGRHVTRMRTIYAERNSCLSRFGDSLARHGARLLPSGAGLHACAMLRPDQDEAVVIDAALRAGIGLYGLRSTYLGARTNPGLIFGFGNLDAAGIQQAMTRLLPLLARA